MKQSKLGARVATLLVVILLTSLACRDAGLNPEETFSGRICRRLGDGCADLSDTTLLRGESMAAGSEAEYRFGFGFPITVAWGASDTTVIALSNLPDAQTQVTARAPGTALLVALINGEFVDTVVVTVVDTGAVRWRRSLGGALATSVAVTDSGLIVVTDAAGGLVAFRSAGDTAWRDPGACATAFGPSLAGPGAAVAGAGCVRVLNTSGTLAWSDTLGNADAPAAVTGDGGLVVLAHHDSAGTGQETLTLTKYSAIGTVVWRDTLRMGPGPEVTPTRSGPSIALNGDIYVTARSPDDSAWIARVSSAGAVRWSVPLVSSAPYTTPAVVGARVYVVHRSGVAVRDSAGAAVYDTPFSAIFGGTKDTSLASSPVIDGSGNLYALSEYGLFSLSPTGAVRWTNAAITVGTAGIVPSPSLIGTGALVVPCQLGVCGIDRATGQEVWRTDNIAAAGTALFGDFVTAPDGILYGVLGGELVSLWHRTGMAVGGWPARANGVARTGRAQQ